jgi:lysophospholipase L1-like esterase
VRALRAHLGPALAGGGLCFALWWGWAATRPERAGAGWEIGASPVELAAATLAGPLRPLPWALELRALQAMRAPQPLAVGDTVGVSATLPDGGSLLVRSGTQGGIAAPVGGPGRAPPQGAGRGPPPGPGGAPGPGGPPPGGGAPPTPPGGAAGNREAGDGILFDRGPAARVRGVGAFTCGELALPDGAVEATLTVAADGVEVVTPGGRTRCSGGRLVGPWVVRAGVERVRVHAVTHSSAGEVRSVAGRVPAWQGRAAAVVSWLAGAAVAVGLARRGWASRALLPAAAAPLLALLPAERWLESVRLLDFPEGLVPLSVTGALALLGGGVAAARRWPLAKALLASTLPSLLLLGLAPRYPDAPGWALLAAALVPWTGLVWANHRGVRAVGVWSWAALAGMALCVEGGLRLTAAGRTWVHTSGYDRAATEFRELLELRKWREYPSDGFPVKPPELRPGVRRIVALGGSSTGGAYQMDDIDLFWPRAMETAIGNPSWEVVNQGVGGWNTLHIRLYVESQLERLSPDILVLYVGHNDLFSTGVATHKQLLARYQAPPNAVLTSVIDGLRGIRSYVGLSFFLMSWRGEAAVAVPLPDARENLSTILDLAATRHIHVLMMTEGLHPDPAPMQPYAALLDDLAREHGQRSLNAAARFVEDDDPDDFLDDCHLTVQGHRRLAGWALEDLRAAGWL